MTQPTTVYAVVENAGGNRYNVVCHLPTIVAKELRWEEAWRLANELNTEKRLEEHS